MSSDKAPVTIKKYANRRLYDTASSAYVTLEDLAAMVKSGSDFVVTDAKNGEDITRSVLAQIIFEQEGKHGQSMLPITFLRQLIRFYGSGLQMLVPSFLEMSLTNFAKEGGVFGQALASQALAGQALASQALASQALESPPYAKGGFPGIPFAAKAFPHNPLASAARPLLEQLEEQTRRNMAMFQKAMAMFATPPQAMGGPAAAEGGMAKGDTPATPAYEPAPPAPPAPPIGGAAEPAPEPRRSDEMEAMRRELGEMQRRLEMLAGKEG